MKLIKLKNHILSLSQYLDISVTKFSLISKTKISKKFKSGCLNKLLHIHDANDSIVTFLNHNQLIEPTHENLASIESIAGRFDKFRLNEIPCELLLEIGF